MTARMSKDLPDKLLRPKIPCLFCEKMLRQIDKKDHNCWSKK